MARPIAINDVILTPVCRFVSMEGGLSTRMAIAGGTYKRLSSMSLTALTAMIRKCLVCRWCDDTMRARRDPFTVTQSKIHITQYVLDTLLI